VKALVALLVLAAALFVGACNSTTTGGSALPTINPVTSPETSPEMSPELSPEASPSA
jgi:hypothetical protein